MELDKKRMKQYFLLIAFGIILYMLLNNLPAVAQVTGFLFRLFSPFLLGLSMAFILNVPLRLIETGILDQFGKKSLIWSKCKRGLAILLTLGLVIGILFALMFLIIPEITKTIRIITDSLPGYIDSLLLWADNMCQRFGISLDTLNQIEINWESMEKTISGFLKVGSASLVNTTVIVTTGIFSGIFNFVMSIVFAIYTLVMKESLSRQTKKLLAAFLPPRITHKILEIASLSHRIFSNFVSGQVTEAVIIGLLCFIGMSIFSMPYAPMISALVGFTALIPVFGAFIGTGVGAFLILMVNPVKAVWFVIFIVVLQQLEGNFIYPKVVGKSVGLPGIWVMLAVLIGGSLYGAFGMLIGVPLCSILYSILRSSVNHKIKTPSTGI